MIFKWVGEILLGTSAPVILSEIGFLDRLEDPQQNQLADDGATSEVIGRIDNVLLHPTKNAIGLVRFGSSGCLLLR